MRSPMRVVGAVYRRKANADEGELLDAIITVERIDEDAVQIVADDVKGASVMFEFKLNAGDEVVRQLQDAIREDWHG